jgi:hypothetical protein
VLRTLHRDLFAALALLLVLAGAIYLTMTSGCDRAFACDNGTRAMVWHQHSDGNLYLFRGKTQLGAWYVRDRFFLPYDGAKGWPWGEPRDCPPIPVPEITPRVPTHERMPKG